MNKVFSCADGCGVKTNYQDADSTHLNYDGVDKVVKRYKKYGLEWVGEDLVNFHVDFPGIEKGCGEAYAIESFFQVRRFILIIQNIQIKKAK